uniref:protein BUNDLE SHEATH DEFECTIVE 2, chloroplastic n=1 Tax=Erigeron canadensis TaxID=72917 RepID=UPI001CB9652B|nr:protein BUNDLE SHEATH DEFECTIVE 2, chloroplastic [Erigeron canadensis]
MECCLKISASMNLLLPQHLISTGFRHNNNNASFLKIVATVSHNGHPSSTSQLSSSSTVRDMHRKLSSVESRFCYDKPIPEEIIENPVGLSLGEKCIGNRTRCPDCEAKGAILCVTCSGSGLYVDSIMESQGIIVKVRCVGCGGTGNIMCSECGGRGHRGLA